MGVFAQRKKKEFNMAIFNAFAEDIAFWAKQLAPGMQLGKEEKLRLLKSLRAAKARVVGEGEHVRPVPFDRAWIAPDQQGSEMIVDGGLDGGRRVPGFAQPDDSLLVGVDLYPDDTRKLFDANRFDLRDFQTCPSGDRRLYGPGRMYNRPPADKFGQRTLRSRE